MEKLAAEDLLALVRRVFIPRDTDSALAFILDLPDEHTSDHAAWRARREMVLGWAGQLGTVREELSMNVHLYLYRNVRHNNAELPFGAWAHRYGPLPASADALDPNRLESFDSIFSAHSIIIAPTQFSATAPLKLGAREYGFRAATMPGFSASMIPALRLDYGEINERCHLLKSLLDPAVRAEVVFIVDGEDEFRLTIDLRYRKAHASGGLFPEPGTAGNLPSGETYIVPYEGEVEGVPTISDGMMPVQFGDEVVVYVIENNRAVRVRSSGEMSRREARLLEDEPAYGNLSELGLGVLADYGLDPTGEILLDEKLGLHIAFGRSDHFGGQVGPGDFSTPEAVVHIDRVYLPQTQPRVSVESVDLTGEDGSQIPLIRNNKYVVEF